MPGLGKIQSLGKGLLAQTSQPAPRVRLLQDGLRLPSDDPSLLEAQTALLETRHVQALAESQWPDGSWGRFHSQDTKIKQRFRTTEAAVSRALALGLDKDSPILQKAIDYMLRHLRGEVEWRDPPENHDDWEVNIQFVTAGTLSRIDLNHPALQPYCQTWVEIVRRTFHAGVYDPLAERQAHLDLYGERMRNKYFRISPLYPLLLLSAANPGLPEELQTALLDWVWDKPDGIYYVCDQRVSQVPDVKARRFQPWLGAMELLSRFPYWGSLAGGAINWLWGQQETGGGWDFGPLARDGIHFPLSGSWRNPLDRKIDCSARLLGLMRRFDDLKQ
jgi:hypothetical protein